MANPKPLHRPEIVINPGQAVTITTTGCKDRILVVCDLDADGQPQLWSDLE